MPTTPEMQQQGNTSPSASSPQPTRNSDDQRDTNPGQIDFTTRNPFDELQENEGGEREREEILSQTSERSTRHVVLALQQVEIFRAIWTFQL